MNRTLGKLVLVALSASALAACSTSPSKPAPAPEPVVQKAAVDLMLEIRKKELELERTEQMAWLKYAAESGSDMVKGFIMGRSAAAAPRASSGGGSTTQMVLQAKAQADEVALRREEMAERNSLWNRSLQLYDRAENLVMFSQGLKFKKFQIQTANDQERYRLGTVRGAQADGFAAGSGATLNGVTAGHSTTLGGISAGANAAATGARAVQPVADQPSTDTTETPAE